MSEIEYTRFNLRIPANLLDAVKASADERSHSTNAEIIDRLQRSFSGGAGPKELLAVEHGGVRRTLGVINQFLFYLSSNNKTAEEERELLLYLIRKQEEMLNALVAPLPPIANEDIDRAEQAKRRE